jgi:hypothetical protein
MAKYKIVFEHTEKTEYIAFVEAQNTKEANEIVNADPFLYVQNKDGESCEGTDFKIISTTEV